MKKKEVIVNKKVVGTVKDGTLSREIDSSKHLLRTPPAIAFDELALSEAEEQGASKIKVKDKLTGITYYSTIEAVRSRGFTFNRGFGNQRLRWLRPECHMQSPALQCNFPAPPGSRSHNWWR